MFNKASLISWARKLKRNIFAIWIASRSKRTPSTAKIIAVVVAGYALSPIDLIPDFIPVLGYLDDLIIVPAGLALAIRLIPEKLMTEFTQKAEQIASKPVSYTAAMLIVLVWILISIPIFLMIRNRV